MSSLNTRAPSLFFLILFYSIVVSAQEKVPIIPRPHLTVDFSKPVALWDGFGVNYVETSQTRDYEKWPQEYGGFSLLDDREKREILDLIFGSNGLKPGITKLFLDPFHEGLTIKDNDNGNANKIDQKKFNHSRTTNNILFFNTEGLRISKSQGRDLRMITTLYGPPAWMTNQNFILGRDVNKELYNELSEYITSWVSFLVKEKQFPIRYVSIHNEGDAYYRWPADGSTPGEDHRDYNAHWSPEQVAEFLPILKTRLKQEALDSVQVTPGETQNWYRFDTWGYARALAENQSALSALGLITSHSFAFDKDRKSIYFGDFRSAGTDLLRSKKSSLHAWVTSMSWGGMGAEFIDEIQRNIYISKVNAVIPWATVQRPSHWIGGDPNSGTAIRINNDSSYTVLPGYYFYKQVSTAGQPGMVVASVTCLDPSVSAIAFASNGTSNPDNFVVINTADVAKETNIKVLGTRFHIFDMYRSSFEDSYKHIGTTKLSADHLLYIAPPGSVTTFYGLK